MGIPYRARVNERWFLNLPGFHGGAYVVAYVEDTTDCGLRRERYHGDDCPHCPGNYEPRTILEIADCSDNIRLEFDVGSDAGRANSLHKLDTLLAALQVFRSGLVEEFGQYDRREREVKKLRKQRKRGSRKTGAGRD
jgi:hypothetical protein